MKAPHPCRTCLATLKRLLTRMARMQPVKRSPRAMDCALVDDDKGEAHWLDVALLVMEVQGRGRAGPG
jgi:hypothetical protein